MGILDKLFEELDIINRLKNEFTKSLSSQELERDFCQSTSESFVSFLKTKGIDSNIVKGFFKVDKPTYEYNDFTSEEQEEAEDMGYDIYDPYDMEGYAKEKGISEELSYIPHVWNNVNGRIVDVTGESQFVKTGMSPDLDESRYFLPKDVPLDSDTIKNFYK